MEVVTLYSDDLLKEVYKILLTQEPSVAISIADLKFVCTPGRGIVDEQLCYDLGYRVYETFHGGGVIVVEPGDIDIAYFGPHHNTFHNDFGEYFTNWLIEKGLKTEFVDNDVLVDGYKVCGLGTKTHSAIVYTVAHIGINTNLENIKQICTKPMKKVPKGLGEYGITSEEIKEMFLEFCEGIE